MRPIGRAPYRSRCSAYAVQPVPRRHEQNGVCTLPCCAHGLCACSSQRLQGKQKRCPACRSLLATYRKRTVPEYTYDIALTRLVATYIEYVASQVMQSSRAIVGACLQRAAVRKADAAAKRSIDLTAVPEQVAARSTHQCPLPTRLHTPVRRRQMAPSGT